MDTCECLNGLVVAGSREVRTLMARLYKTEVDTPSPTVQYGNILASSARDNGGNGVSSGHVRVYFYTGSEWIQLGEDIEGENPGDFFGESVSHGSAHLAVPTMMQF